MKKLKELKKMLRPVKIKTVMKSLSQIGQVELTIAIARVVWINERKNDRKKRVESDVEL